MAIKFEELRNMLRAMSAYPSVLRMAITTII